MRYFLKELVSSPLYLSSGAQLKWESAVNDQGILATEDGYILSQLDSAIRRRVGGVLEIDQARYEQEKKNSENTAESDLSSLSANDARKVIAKLQARLGVLEGRAAAVKQVPPAPPAVRESEPLVVPDLEPVIAKPRKTKTK